jgi:hypothetical protein
MEQSYLLSPATITSIGHVLPNGFECMLPVHFASTTFSKAVTVHNGLMLTQLPHLRACVHQHPTRKASKQSFCDVLVFLIWLYADSRAVFKVTMMRVFLLGCSGNL